MWITIALSLLGCRLQRMLPGNAVLGAAELSSFEASRPSPVRYTSPHQVDFVVLPLQVFGVFYDLDLVVVSRHPSWDMHEYARVSTPEGPLWFAKDSRPDGVQTIIAAQVEIEGLLAEVPVPRRTGAVAVVDRSEGRKIDIELSYVNPDGEPVELEFRGKLPDRPPSKRNGSTMGHSRQAAAVVLDLERFGPGGRVRMRIGGERVGIRRIVGTRMRYLIAQAQGGIAVASYQQLSADGGFTLQRPGPGAVDPVSGEPGWPTASSEYWTASTDHAVYETGLTRLEYDFVLGGLYTAKAWQVGREQAVFELWLDPALPDLSRAFEGVASSRFRMDANGQPGHGSGVITARWQGDEVMLQVVPDKPWWLADRPLEGRVSFPGDGSAVVQTTRSN